MTNRQLIFVGDSSWDLYADQNGTVWAVPKPEACPSTKTCYFGNRSHLLKLMRSGDDLGEITEAGREFLSGLYNRLMGDWNLLTFA